MGNANTTVESGADARFVTDAALGGIAESSRALSRAQDSLRALCEDRQAVSDLLSVIENAARNARNSLVKEDARRLLRRFFNAASSTEQR